MRQSGLYVGACPIYGYLKLPENKNLLAPVVQRIFEMKLAGIIATRLNSEGVLSPLEYKRRLGLPHPHHGFTDRANAKWSASIILRILKDETYTGTLVQGKQYKLNYKLQKNVTRPTGEWVRCANTHEAIISPQDFETIQRILLLDTRTSPCSDAVNPFSGLLICGSYGGNMTRKMVRHSDVVYRYYYYPAGKRKGCSAPVLIPEDVLKEIVFDAIGQHIEKVKALYEEIKQMTDKEIIYLLTRKTLADLEVKQAELQKLQEYKSSLRISEIRDIINVEDCQYTEVTYTEDILQHEKSITELIMQVDKIAGNIIETIYEVKE